MWVPEPQSGTREDWLRVRRCLQVRPCLHLQALVSGAIMPRIAPSSPTAGLGPVRGVTLKPVLGKDTLWDTESEVYSR